MNLQQQVTSLEISKRLKELGVKQGDNQFYWIIDDVGKEVNLCWHKELATFARYGVDLSGVSAFTVAELGEMLPIGIPKEEELVTLRGEHHWNIGYRKKDVINGVADTEADARAKMMIYLLENKLV